MIAQCSFPSGEQPSRPGAVIVKKSQLVKKVTEVTWQMQCEYKKCVCKKCVTLIRVVSCNSRVRMSLTLDSESLSPSSRENRSCTSAYFNWCQVQPLGRP